MNDQFIPQLVVVGGSDAMEFYKRALGAEELMRTMTPDGQRLIHGELMLDCHKFYVSDEAGAGERGTCKSPNTLGGTGVRIVLYVADADESFERAIKAGAREIMPVKDMFWGGRYGQVLDPFGHEWGISQELQKRSPAQTQKGANQYLSE